MKAVMARKQSHEDRLRRLKEYCCPVHGTIMSQIDIWYYPVGGRDYTFIGCGRRDCAITVRQYGDGELELTDAWSHLLDVE